MIDDWSLRTMTAAQLEAAASRRGREGATLREEIAACSQGSPVNFNAFMKCTRYEMWLIYLGGG